MTDYQQLRIDIADCTETVTDLLAAFLADVGYDSFVPDPQGLTAFIPADQFSLDAVENIIAEFPMEIDATISDELVPGQDWNAEWEKNYFQPIIVGGDQCVIHSSFHTDIPKAKYDIVIDPKMAFGTGHHATTSQIVEYLLELPLEGKRVIDMGTGTGILAILCLKRGAACAVGIEIDPGAWENAVENASLNDAAAVEMLLGDATRLEGLEAADLFIANINRNIILADIDAYAAALKPGALMLLSGFYESDAPLILEAAAPLGLTEVSRRVRDDWTVLLLQKS